MGNNNVAVALLGVGMAIAAALLNINGEDAGFLWLGVLICFIAVN